MSSSRIKKELERLEKNKARRQAREQQKELHSKPNTGGDAGSPGAAPASDKVATGTTRKCANCGQVGHIKTNKKYDSFSFSYPNITTPETALRLVACF